MNNATSPNHLYSLESTLLWPQRDHIELHEELHSRPAMSVRTPSVISYWAQKKSQPRFGFAGYDSVMPGLWS